MTTPTAMTPAEAARAIVDDITLRQLDAGPRAIVNTVPYFALAEAFQRFADLIDPPPPEPEQTTEPPPEVV